MSNFLKKGLSNSFAWLLSIFLMEKIKVKKYLHQLESERKKCQTFSAELIF